MSTNVRTVVGVTALVSMVLVCVGTAQAAPTTIAVPNSNFQSYDVYYANGGSTHYNSLSDGQLTPYTNPSGPWGYSSMWDVALGDGTGNARAWNPSSTNFATAGGNGALPGTAAGSQCFVNSATTWNNDVDLVNGNSDETYGQAVATLAGNKRYTFTVAVGSALGAPVMDGQSLGFADITSNALLASHDDMYPNGWYRNGLNNGGVQNMTGFQGWGGFGDISFSVNANDLIGTMGAKSGDGLCLVIGAGAGTAWSNVRLISQNWLPMYAAGNFTWDNNTTSAWSTTSGGPYSNKWASGQDAVFEGTGGTVTVPGTISSVNSLNFNTDATTGSYTLTGSGKITLTGDAVITVGAGTDNVNNAGGGTATVACVLDGTVGMYKAGAGKLILTGANIYTGGTTVGGGTLQIGGGGTTGSIAGNVSNLANLAFNRSDNFTYGGVISGTGSIDILGSGPSAKTILTGANTYTGITTVHAGSTLQVGNGGVTGSIAGDVVNNGNLIFNRSDTVSYSGVIYDGSTFFPSTPGGNGYSTIYNNEVAQPGTLTQAGPGRLILNNSQMLYTGVTNVQNGALEIDGASPTMNVLVNVGGVNITGGMLILNYTSGSDPAHMVQSLLQTAQASHFETGQIRDTALPAGYSLTWADSPTIDGYTYANEVVITIVPEPSTLVLLSIGAVSLFAYVWRKRTRTA